MPAIGTGLTGTLTPSSTVSSSCSVSSTDVSYCIHMSSTASCQYMSCSTRDCLPHHHSATNASRPPSDFRAASCVYAVVIQREFKELSGARWERKALEGYRSISRTFSNDRGPYSIPHSRDTGEDNRYGRQNFQLYVLPRCHLCLPCAIAGLFNGVRDVVTSVRPP